MISLAWIAFGCGMLYVRVVGIGRGLTIGGTWHPDERLSTAAGIGADLSPHWFHYPSLYLYGLQFLHLALFLLFRFLGVYEGSFSAFTGDAIVARYLVARLATVALSGVVLWMTWRMGRAVGGKRTGMVASILLACNPVHLFLSRCATVSMPLTVVVLFAVMAVWRWVLLGGRRRAAWSGCLVGWAVAVKYNLVTLGILLPAAALLRRDDARERRWELGVALAFVPLAYLVAVPYTLLDFPTFWQDVTAEYHLHGPRGEGPMLAGHWNYLVISAEAYGLPLLIALFAGVFLLLWRSPRRACLLTLFPLSHWLVMGALGTRLSRYLLPTLPLVTILAAFAVEEVARFFPTWKGVIRAALLLGLLLPMGIRDLRLVETFRSPDTRELATHWIETHLPPGSRILVESNGNYGPTVREEIFQPVPLEFHPTRRAPTVSDLLAGEIDAVVTTELYRPLDDGRFSAMLDHTPCIQEIQRFPGPYLPELFRNPEIRVYAVDRICLATTDPPGTETNRHGSGADPLGLGKKEGYEKNASFVPFRASKKVEIR